MSRAGRRLSLPLALTHGCRRRGSLGGPGTPLASSPRSAASAFAAPQIFSIPDAASDAPSVVPSSPSKKNAGQRSILAKLMGHRGSFQASVSSSAHESVLAPLQSEDAADAHDAPLEPIVPPGERIALDPVSAPRCRWDLFIVCCVLYNAVVLPFRLGFGDDTFGPLSILDCLIDVMFLVDIWLNMNTGFIPDGGGPPERRLRVARRRYLRQMFVVDLVSSVPADLPLLLDVGGDTRTRMTLRLPRLLRLLRLPRLFRYARRWILYTGSERATQVLHAIKIASGIILFPHLDACVLFFLQALQDFPETGWVSCEGLEDASKIHQYTYALFIATSHMLCIGYGPPCYSPATSVELGITIGSMIVGASLYIMLIASISSSFLERSVQGTANAVTAARISATSHAEILTPPLGAPGEGGGSKPVSAEKAAAAIPNNKRRGSLSSLEAKLDFVASALAGVSTDVYALAASAQPTHAKRPSTVDDVVLGRPSFGTAESPLASPFARALEADASQNHPLELRSAWHGKVETATEEGTVLNSEAILCRRGERKRRRQRLNSWPSTLPPRPHRSPPPAVTMRARACEDPAAAASSEQ